MKAFKKDQSRPQYNPIAVMLKNDFAYQIRTFINCDADRKEAYSKLLFDLPYPARLNTEECPEADHYLAYTVERSTSYDPAHPHRMTGSVVVLDTATNMPAFYVSAFIVPSGEFGSIRVYELNDRGPIYRRTVRWDSRDDDAPAEVPVATVEPEENTENSED